MIYCIWTHDLPSVSEGVHGRTVVAYRVFKSRTTNPPPVVGIGCTCTGSCTDCVPSVESAAALGERKYLSRVACVSSALSLATLSALRPACVAFRLFGVTVAFLASGTADWRRLTSSTTPKTRNSSTKPKTGISRCQGLTSVNDDT